MGESNRKYLRYTIRQAAENLPSRRAQNSGGGFRVKPLPLNPKPSARLATGVLARLDSHKV